MLLPTDTINEIITHIELPNLFDLCSTSKTINKMCQDNVYLNIYKNHIRHIACGNTFTYIINNNQLFSFGANDYGQLGLGNYNVYDSPQLVDLQDPVSVTCGDDHVIVLTKNGLYGCGNNKTGQLGIGTNMKRNNTFRKINLKNIVAVVCGANHTIVLTKTGLYSFGYNREGQLGLGTTHFSNNEPMRINIDIDLKDIELIRCGSDHTIILTKYNVYGFGSNYYGQLIDCKNCMVPTILNIDDIEYIDAEHNCTFVIKDGQLLGCGSNLYGELGINSDNSTITKLTLIDIDDVRYISSGERFTIFVKEIKDNYYEIYGCGDNWNGQLGLENKRANYLEPTFITDLNYDIVDIISNGAHTIIQCTDGNDMVYYSFGNNQYGQLGLGHDNSVNGLQMVLI